MRPTETLSTSPRHRIRPAKALEPNDAGGRRDDARNVPEANRRVGSVSNALDARKPEATVTRAHNGPGGLEGGAAVGGPDGVQPALIGLTPSIAWGVPIRLQVAGDSHPISAEALDRRRDPRYRRPQYGG
jgi:hypothetical protein